MNISTIGVESEFRAYRDYPRYNVEDTDRASKLNTKDVNSAYLIKVVPGLISASGRELKRFFRIDGFMLTTQQSEDDPSPKTFDLRTLESVNSPSRIYPTRANYCGPLVDLMLKGKIMSVAARDDLVGSEIFLKKLKAFAFLHPFYRPIPEKGDALTEMFTDYLNDTMVKGLRRDSLLSCNDEAKVGYLKEYQKHLSEHYFALVNAVDCLSYNVLTTGEAHDLVQAIKECYSFMMRIFLNGNGIRLLFNMLKKYCMREDHTKKEKEIIGCLVDVVHYLLCNEESCKAIRKYEYSVPYLLLCLSVDDALIVHKKEEDIDNISIWMARYSEIKREKMEMESIVRILESSTNQEIIADIITFIGKIVSVAPDLYRRITIRSVFLDLHIVDIMNRINEKAGKEQWEDQDTINRDVHNFINAMNTDINQAENEGKKKDRCNHKYEIHVDFLYYKYFKLLKIGFSKEVLQLKMGHESLDPAILNRDISTIAFDNIPKNGRVVYPDGHIEPCWSVALTETTMDDDSEMAPREKCPHSSVLTPVMWDIITLKRDVVRSIWLDMDNVTVTIDKKRIDRAFCYNPSEEVCLLSEVRERDIMNAMKLIRIDSKLSIKALYECDWSILNDQYLEQLRIVAPTQQEHKMCSLYRGDVSRLSKSSQLVFNLCLIPNIKDRIDCCLFIKSISAKEEEFKQILCTYQSCIELIRTSLGLHLVLEIVLTICNYINGENELGGAWGYHVELLTRLDSVLSSDKKTSLLRIVCETIHDQYANALDTIKNLMTLERAQSIPLSEAKNRLVALNKSVNLMYGLSYSSPCCDSDKFPALIKEEYKKVKTATNKISMEMKTLEKDCDEVLEMFGESWESYDINGLFNVFISFCSAFMKEYELIDKK